MLIDEACLRRMRAPRPNRFSFQVLAANHEHARSASQAVCIELRAEQFEVRWRELHQCTVAARGKRRQQVLCRGVFRQQFHSTAGQKRHIEACDSQVEGNRAVDRGRRIWLRTIGAHRPPQVIHQAPVRNHRPLRRAGRPRGVHHVRQTRRSRRRLSRRRLVRVRVEQRRVKPDNPRIADEILARLSVSQNRHGNGVAHHERDAFRRVRRVDRYIRSTGFPYCQQGSDQRRRPFHADAYQRVSTDTATTQERRQGIRPIVELTK
ncbi:MAG: hypothetical protein U0Q11_14405 [Vicinamibacterales bacterium]